MTHEPGFYCVERWVVPFVVRPGFGSSAWNIPDAWSPETVPSLRTPAGAGSGFVHVRDGASQGGAEDRNNSGRFRKDQGIEVGFRIGTGYSMEEKR